MNYEPIVPYPKAMMKDRTEEQFSDDAVTLQARDSVNTSKTQDNAIKPVDDKTNIQSSLQEPSQTKTTEIVRYCHEKNKDIHEERRLRIEELNKWREHKPRTHDKLKLCQNKPDTSPNQLKVGDKVLLDAIDPHIVTTTLNEENPSYDTQYFSIRYGGVFQHTRPSTRACLKLWPNRGRDIVVRDSRVEAGHDFPKTRGTLCRHREERRSRSLPQKDVGDWVLPRYVLQPKFGTRSLNFHKLCRNSYFRYSAYDPSPQVVMTNNDDPGTIHFRLGGGHECTPTQYPHLPLLVLEGFGTILFHLRAQPLEGLSSPPSFRYLHAILAHTLAGRRESTSVVTTHDAYYLWCMANAHVTDLAYFIAFAIHHQTEQHRKGMISIGPYVTHLARHFGLLNTAAQSLALTLIGQMSPQGIMTMLHMQMIERQRGTNPPQYRLLHAIDEEDLEDIPDDVPPQHKEPSTAPHRERPGNVHLKCGR
ncbi:hypothetical protein GOBAR_AA11828 [Gossypium barbadense]|uniref:Uncharacterized protein n=1 Tax=Gossypium barbadense TaxID=3634 RepID=A0A2P5XZQ0_GOSBA|nr:hypothetical protein GOBAR_AA11828 [Gossypium barbadense]